VTERFIWATEEVSIWGEGKRVWRN